MSTTPTSRSAVSEMRVPEGNRDVCGLLIGQNHSIDCLDSNAFWKLLYYLDTILVFLLFRCYFYAHKCIRACTCMYIIHLYVCTLGTL